MVSFVNARGALLPMPFQRKQDAEILPGAFLPKRLISNPDPSFPLYRRMFLFYQIFVLTPYTYERTSCPRVHQDKTEAEGVSKI